MSDILEVARPSEAAPVDRAKPWIRRKRVLIAAAVLPVVVFAGGYLLFFTPDSPSELRLSRPAASSDGTAFGVSTGRWSVGSGSAAGYRVREKLLRLPASNDAVGRTSAIVGDFHIEANSGGFVVKPGMRVDVDVSTLKSDEPRRDDHMRTMGIETDKFPTATFVTTADLVVPAAIVAGDPAKITAHGDLTVHGVTRAVAMPLQAQRNGDRIEVVGSFSFGWDLFEMKQPNLSYVTVESDPTLEVQLFFDHESARTLTGVASDEA